MSNFKEQYISHNMKLTNNLDNIELNKGYCTCGRCGETAEVDTSVVLTSYPPKYNYHCPHCDYHGFTFCSDVFTKPTRIINGSFSSKFLATCLICGEETELPVTIGLSNTEITVCDKCKKAVLKIRKMLESDLDD